MCRNEREQQKREEHRSELVCDLCDKKFKNESELEEHREVYECIHPGCEEKYNCQEMWREHMKEKHGIGFYCEQCNEYCLFEGDDHDCEYECIHLECEEKYVSQEMCREQMKREHGIGFHCEQCNEYCIFEEQLEDHLEEEHMEDEEHIEPNGFECVECNEIFESVIKVIEHENEGECDL